jgi:hypothetical protein
MIALRCTGLSEISRLSIEMIQVERGGDVRGLAGVGSSGDRTMGDAKGSEAEEWWRK